MLLCSDSHKKIFRIDKMYKKHVPSLAIAVAIWHNIDISIKLKGRTVFMYIGLNNIQQLFYNHKSILKKSAHSPCLTGWIQLEHAPAPYVTHSLYICEYNEDLKNIDFITDMSILCFTREITDSGIPHTTFPSSVNVLFLEHDDYTVICTELIDYFNTQCGIGVFADSLLDILFSEDGIQSMINRAYSALDNPIFVFDAGFNLIAANWDEAEKTIGGTKLLENKGFSNNEFKMANRCNIHKKVMTSEVPIMEYNTELGYNQLLCAIDTQKNLGHIVLSAVNRPLRSIDTKFLQILKKCIDQQLKKDEFVRNTEGFHYEYFLKDLLDGKMAIGKPFLNRLAYINKEFSGNMYCLVVETARSSITLNTHRIRNLFESHFPNTKTLMYHGEIIAILSMPKNKDFSKDYLDTAIKICKESNLYAGLSNYFQNIIELPEYHKQALRAIELGASVVDEPNLFLYEDYYLEHMRNIFVQKESPKTFCHPKMKLLLDYDKKHGSDLAHTFYMYLIHERNITSAAAAIHMPRNTVMYRIKKIHSLIEEDYESYRERQYLILSYEINIETRET